MPERNLLLHDGIATHFVDAGDNVCIEREITMYRVNRYGDTDISYLDVQSPATLGRIRYVIKTVSPVATHATSWQVMTCLICSMPVSQS